MSTTPRATEPTSCPCPDKRPFRNEREANARLAAILADPKTSTLPRRSYECPSGSHWHLTHDLPRAIVRPTPLILAHAAAERRNLHERAA